MSSIALEIIKLACHCQIDLYNELMFTNHRIDDK